MATNKGTASAKPARRVPPSQGRQAAERAGTFREPAPEQTGRIKVRATQMGWDGHAYARRRPGDVFYLDDAKQFSSRWMEVVDERTPLKSTGPQEAINQKHDEILGGKSPKPTAASADDDDVD